MKTKGNNGQKIKKSMQLVILPPYVYHCGVDLPIITIIDFIISALRICVNLTDSRYARSLQMPFVLAK